MPKELSHGDARRVPAGSSEVTAALCAELKPVQHACQA